MNIKSYVRSAATIAAGTSSKATTCETIEEFIAPKIKSTKTLSTFFNYLKKDEKLNLKVEIDSFNNQLIRNEDHNKSNNDCLAIKDQIIASPTDFHSTLYNQQINAAEKNWYASQHQAHLERTKTLMDLKNDQARKDYLSIEAFRPALSYSNPLDQLTGYKMHQNSNDCLESNSFYNFANGSEVDESDTMSEF